MRGVELGGHNFEKRQRQSSPDYYTAHRPLQPKAEIADYVERCGLLVPKRYDTLTDALNSGRPFVVRSDHPQELDGASGIASSVFVDPAGIDHPDWVDSNMDWRGFFNQKSESKFAIRNQIIAKIGRLTEEDTISNLKNFSLPMVAQYCRYAGISTQEFMNDLSFSYWEGLSGTNRAIIADNANRGRYHIFSYANQLVDGFVEYLSDDYKIVTDGQITGQNVYAGNEFQESAEDLLPLIEFYEKARSLPRFNNNHCPMIEAQSANGQNYFLQYHRVRDFSPATFTLDREPEPDEVETFLVRGATSQKGITVKVGFHWNREANEPSHGEFEGAVDYLYNPPFTEARARKRRLQLLYESHPNNLFVNDKYHLQRSKLFKPEVTTIITKEDMDKLREGVNYKYMGDTPFVTLRVISDGRKAYLKRVEKSNRKLSFGVPLLKPWRTS